ncbi:WbqC family protein [Streptomyces coerulescens]|uniref:WbqC family protein n=1 Tax=Streptomyces coerulescens TaxID=29304 RepID=A0ABW0CII8_STRCD
MCMALTSVSWAPASTAASSAAESPRIGSRAACVPSTSRTRFPRSSTPTKVHAADRWIVLDDVQFARRDYRHRARSAAPDEPVRPQWLTLPTHLLHWSPDADRPGATCRPGRSRRTVSLLIRLGEVLGSSSIPTLEGHSERLADLAAATSGTHYFCGTGGRYLDTRTMRSASLTPLPAHDKGGVRKPRPEPVKPQVRARQGNTADAPPHASDG